MNLADFRERVLNMRVPQPRTIAWAVVVVVGFVAIGAVVAWAGVSGFVDQSTDFSEMLGLD